MGIYKFESVMTVTDVFDIDADSYEEAMAEANDIASDGWYAVAPAGYSSSWDDVQVICIEEPSDD